MEKQYFREHSPTLGREMEWKLYGHGGRPVLFIPCQDGRFFDFEDFGMSSVWSPWINSGQVMVFAIDTLDKETWSNKGGDPYWRIRRHEQWVDYITGEMVPLIQETARRRGSWKEESGILTFGCSLGATHAANLYLRRPDLFNGMLALSGIYNADYGFDGYMDEVVYQNSPVHYMANLPENYYYIDIFNKQRAAICVGLFVRSEVISQTSADLSRAVSEARSAAECYKAAGGNLEKMADLTGGTLENGTLRLYYDQDWQKVGDCGTGVELLFLLELIPELPAETGLAAARLEISGPAAAEDLLAEPILSWEIAALEVAS